MKIKKKGIAVAAVFGLASVGVVQVGASAAESDPVLVKKPGEVPKGAVEDATSAYLTPDQCDTTRSWTLTVPATEGTSHEEYQFTRHHDPQPAITHPEYRYSRTFEATTHPEYRWSVVKRSDQYRWSVLERADKYRWSVVTRSDRYRWSVVQRADQYRWSVLTRKLIPGTPETTKVIHHPAVTKTIHHPAETKTIHHPAETKTVHHEAETHTEWKYVKHGGRGEVWLASNAFKYHWSNGTDSNGKPPRDSHIDYYERSGKTRSVTDKEAWDETVTVKEAWDETVTVKDAWDETVTVKEAWDETVTVPGTPDSYTNWRWTRYTDWQESATPPAIENPDLVKYDSRYHRLGPWKWSHYSDWQASKTPPEIDDPTRTKYGSRYHGYTGWRWSHYSDWQASKTPPEISDPDHTKYGSRYHDYTGWRWSHYTHEWGEPWSLDPTPPPLDDPEHTTYGTRYHGYTPWKWEKYTHEWGEPWSLDPTPPPLDDPERTKYGTRYEKEVVDEPARVEKTGWLQEPGATSAGEPPWEMFERRDVLDVAAVPEYTEYYILGGDPTREVSEASWVLPPQAPEGWEQFAEQTVMDTAGTPEQVTHYAWTDGKQCDESDDPRADPEADPTDDPSVTPVSNTPEKSTPDVPTVIDAGL